MNINPALTERSYSASIIAIDVAGNVSTPTSVSFVVDETAPVVPSYTVSPNPTSGAMVVIFNPVESGSTTSIA